MGIYLFVSPTLSSNVSAEYTVLLFNISQNSIQRTYIRNLDKTRYYIMLSLLKINWSRHASFFISKWIIGNVESNIHYGFKI